MRKLLSILLCLVLGMVLLLPAWAATSGAFLYRDYDVTEGTVYCYGKQVPWGGTLTVSYGANKVDGTSFSTVRKAKVPVTVYCLVDSATSVSKTVKQHQQDILQTINSLMSNEDSMVIATIDKTFFEGELLTDSATRATAIESISRSSWVSNLYVGIDQAVDSVCTNTTYHTNRALLILSDGHSDGKEKIQTGTILEKIRAARIPVYTFIVGSPSTNRTQNELTTLKQFSEASMGGTYMNLSEDTVTAVNAADTVWDSLQDSSVISISAASLPNDKDAELLIRYETGDTRYEDTILIRAVDLPETTVPNEETTQETPQETEDPPKEDPPEEETPWLLVGIIAAVVVAAAAAVIVIVILRRKKAAPQPADSSDSVGASDIPSNMGWDSYSDSGFKSGSDSGSDSGFESGFESVSDSPIPGPTIPVSGDCHVFMVAIMHPDVTRDFWLTEGSEQKIGRDSSVAIVPNGNDKNLSRIHASILWDGAHLLVQDKHSTCGTYINGVRCAGEAWYLVENGATVRVGAYDYRVTYQTKEKTK